MPRCSVENCTAAMVETLHVAFMKVTLSVTLINEERRQRGHSAIAFKSNFIRGKYMQRRTYKNEVVMCICFILTAPLKEGAVRETHQFQ